jgi:hypothetical protein
MNKKVFVKGAVMFALLGLMSTTAFAVVDDKVNAGGLCYHVSGGVFTRFGGTVANNGTTEMNVDCPVVRDNIVGGFGSSAISFDVFDRHSTIDVTCTLCNESGTTTGLTTSCGSPAVSTGVNQTGIKKIWVTTPPGSIGPNVYSYAHCTLPRVGSAMSHIARIHYDEQ